MRRPFFAVAAAAVLAAGLLPAPGAAQPQWSRLPDAPFRPGDRHEDIWFATPSLGWVVNLSGEIWHTSDRGESWEQQSAPFGLYRCVTFASPEVGFVGKLHGSPPMLRTVDGGRHWEPAAGFPDDVPGICGMWAVDRRTVWAVGAYYGSPSVVRTRDGGRTWESFDVSGLIDSIVDCWFPEPNRGFVAGGLGEFPATRGCVLRTTDDGATWEQVHVSARPGEWCWKISFPTEQFGAISMQRFGGVSSFLRTTDGGSTWTEPHVRAVDTQGIGFISPNEGWIGGFGTVTLKTTDGGNGWAFDPTLGVYLNRVRVLRGDLAYAVGNGVYRYSTHTPGAPGAATAVVPASAISRERPANLSVAPNPFRERTRIRFATAARADARVWVHDVTGRLVRELHVGALAAGEHELDWDGRDESGSPVASGAYFVRIEAGPRREARDVILIR